MKKIEKQAYVMKRAYELASSGEHHNYLSIEHTITWEGYPEARHILDNGPLRDRLKKMCDLAREKRANSS